MGRVPGAIYGQVFSRDSEACQGLGVPRAKAGSDDSDGLRGFTELARLADDYVATDMGKVRRFENGLKLSIHARIVGLRLQDMDSMVGTALTIEREMEDARNTWDASVSGKRKDSQSSSNSGKRQRTSSS